MKDFIKQYKNKKNQENFIKYINKRLELFKLFLFTIIFPIFHSKKLLRNLYYSSEITLKIKGKGDQYIITNKEETNYNYVDTLPDKIYINGIKQEQTGKIAYNLIEEYNVVTLEWEYPLKNCSNMFRSLKNITSADLSKFDSSKAESMYCMFIDCTNLKTINLKNLDTSLVTNMRSMFHGCSSLISLDLSNFDTSSLVITYHMFIGCSSLIFLNLISFKEDKIPNSQYVNDMFSGVPQDLIYCIDENEVSLIKAEIDSLNSINKCDNNCFKANYKLNTNQKECISICSENGYLYEYNNECFSRCPIGTFISADNKYKCVDLCDKYYNYDKTECLNQIPEGYFLNDTIHKTIDKCHSNCQTCKEKGTNNNNNCLTCKDSTYYDFGNCVTNCTNGLLNNKECKCSFFSKCKTCSLDSIKYELCVTCNDGYYQKYNDNSNINSYINCYKDLDEYYLDSNIYRPCYSSCKKCYGEGNESNHNCIQCNTNYIFLNDSKYINNCYQSSNAISTENIEEYKIFDYFYNICNKNINESLTNDDILKNIEEELVLGNLDNFLDNSIFEKKEDLIVKGKDIIYTISTSEIQNNSKNINASTIILGECEKKLKAHYNISENETLLILKVDVFEEEALIPTIEYKIFSLNNKTNLDLKFCEGTKIKTNIPVLIDEKEIVKHDPKSEYFNNICYTYTSEKGTDISINDRRKDFIKNNMSLCESNCDFEGYDIYYKKASCECEVKIKFTFISDIVINKEKLKEKFFNFKKYINFNVIKCWSLLFSKQGIITNYGNYIILAIILANLVLLLSFVLVGFNLILLKIIRIKNIIQGNAKNHQIIKACNKKFGKISRKNKKKTNSIRKLKSGPPLKNQNHIKNLKNSCTINILPTNSGIKRDKSSYKKFKSIDNLIRIDTSSNSKTFQINNFAKTKHIFNENKRLLILNDFEINSLVYLSALRIDKRTYCQYYLSLIKIKNILIFTFHTNNDYNSKIIKIFLFLFSFSLYLTVNSFFFNDSTIHRLYLDEGEFNFIYQLPNIIYSTLICNIVNTIVNNLSLTERNILKFKMTKINIENNLVKLVHLIKIKFILFFMISFSFLFFFWYYVSCFCAVYKNTQLHLIKDSFISFGMTLLYPFVFCLLPGIFRIPALRSKNRKCIYKISQIIQLF